MGNSIVLKPVSQAALADFNKNAHEIVQRSADDAMKRLTHETRDRVVEGLTFVTRFIASAMQLGSTELLKSDLDWAMIRLPFEGVDAEEMEADLLSMEEAAKTLVDPGHSGEVIPYFSWMRSYIASSGGDLHSE